MLSTRPFGAELEVMLPADTACLPAAADTHTRVAKFLRRHGIDAVSEFELAHHRRNFSDKTWLVKEDDSLRTRGDRQEGTEIVSPIMSGEADLKKLRQVAHILQEHGFTTNELTGFHVHHDVTDLDIDGWKRLMVNFVLAEPAFDRLVDEGRRGNNNRHALSTRQEPDIMPLIEHFDDEMTFADIGKELFPGVRSNHDLKLNVDAFWKHGTAEFRQHQGSVCPDQIEHWVRLTQAFVDHAANSPTLIAVNAGVTDPEEAWDEVTDERKQAQDRLLENLIGLAPEHTRQYYRAVAGAQNDNRPALVRAARPSVPAPQPGWRHAG